MILLDDRAGSRDLAPHFAKLGTPYRLDRLPFGDCAFLGRGPADTWVHVGVEYKTLDDLLSCLTTGRFVGHQLPGMRATYDQSWLLIEGVWRVNPESGFIEIPRAGRWETLYVNRRGFGQRELDKHLLTLTVQGGVLVHRVGTERESARWVASLYSWWTSEWDKHASLHTFDWSGPAGQFTEPDLVQAVAAQLPGVGWVKSKRVAEHFRSVLEMVAADRKEWASIDGIGKVIADRIVRAVQGEGERR